MDGISDAAAYKDFVVLSTYRDLQFHIRLLKVSSEGIATLVDSQPVDGEVTGLSMGVAHRSVIVMAGIWREHASSLAQYRIDESDGRLGCAYAINIGSGTCRTLLCRQLLLTRAYY